MRSRRISLLLAAAFFALGTTSIVRREEKPQEKKDKKAKKTPTSVHHFKVKDIDGKAVALRKYRDQVLLVVNVASK
jgi:glutathione peroxidase